MKKVNAFLLILSLAGCSLCFLPFQQWKIREGYNVAIDNYDVTGKFEKMNGTIVFDEKNPENARFVIRVDVKSLSTGNILKTTNALTEDWFYASKYPSIDFVSTQTEKTGNTYKVTGNLTIRGVTKRINIPFSFVPTGKEGLFTGEFTINRTDYKVGSPDSDVEYDVKIKLKIPVSRISE